MENVALFRYTLLRHFFSPKKTEDRHYQFLIGKVLKFNFSQDVSNNFETSPVIFWQRKNVTVITPLVRLSNRLSLGF